MARSSLSSLGDPKVRGGQDRHDINDASVLICAYRQEIGLLYREIVIYLSINTLG
jgi:hypothetical protein